IFRIPDEPDNVVRGLRGAGGQVHLKRLPDRIDVREVAARERLVHDDHCRSIRPVTIVERESRHRRRLHHAEIVAAQLVEADLATPPTITPPLRAIAPCPSVDDRLPKCTASAGSRRVADSAGLRPNSTHVRQAEPATKANTRQSGDRSTKILAVPALRNVTS